MAEPDKIVCTAAPLDPQTEHRLMRDKVAGDGAIVSFTGIARPDTQDDKQVRSLRLEHYPGFTEASIAKGVAKVRACWSIGQCHIVHRVGDMVPGDPIVFVATSARHRRAAFEATDFLMDWLKTEAAFWKCEITANGTKWIEPRAEDIQDRERWEYKANG
ncbi:molybdenum cofactor biosynthesis protein MoaE [Alterisphingorhabdus coralli]|uniref:Molybdopterin synthase catalytic subunit n=1 Tax=Alterisphingorhabdus coralli TaxID=3071408 RepID=A0AA97F6P6_9SPHN|nr:molybdenum cofactor biosynthesis protein MoaE [Parasphingorhabdus sp. SCSIO 66989]WOE74953.1 molybdenum cofactor biosynthesis protein MoaE [Parasphingorhabdus sp. SCSIO 66989]